MTDTERTRELLRESGEIIRTLCQDAKLEVVRTADASMTLETALRNLADVMRELAVDDERSSRA